MHIILYIADYKFESLALMYHSNSTTVDREFFVLKFFPATIFRGVKFSLSGPSTKIYHIITATSMEKRALWLVASALIVKSGRHLAAAEVLM